MDVILCFSYMGFAGLSMLACFEMGGHTIFFQLAFFLTFCKLKHITFFNTVRLLL